MKSIFKLTTFSSQIMVFSVLLMWTMLGQAETARKYPCARAEAQQIRVAIFAYLNKDSAVAAKDVTLLSERCVSAYASAIVHPVKPITDDALVYLHKVNGHWQVMTLGTSFDEEFLAQLPKELRSW